MKLQQAAEAIPTSGNDYETFHQEPESESMLSENDMHFTSATPMTARGPDKTSQAAVPEVTDANTVSM